MKKLIKTALALAGIAVCLDAANRAVFALAERTGRAAKRDGEKVYKWRFGRVRYVVTGHVDAPPLLLVHGVGMGAGLHEWDAAMPELSRHYRVYALDLLGFGQSEKSAVTVSAYLYSLLIHDFAKHVIGEKTFVVANNLSCSFAAVASQMGSAQSLFAKMLFIAPHSLRQTSPRRRHAWLKKLLECPILGTSIYLVMASRCILRTHLERLGLAKVTNAQIDAFYAAAHHGGANARYTMASFLTNFLYVETDRALRMAAAPVQIIDEDSDCCLYPHIEDATSLYQTCHAFFEI